MKRYALFLPAILALVWCGCRHEAQTPAPTGQPAAASPDERGDDTQPSLPKKRRPPREYRKVVESGYAGRWYEAHADDLAKQVDKLLADAKTAKAASVDKTEPVRGLISPHAGYQYSGPVAAVAYRQLQGRPIDTVVIMAPSHTALFKGASIPDVEAYHTPLGFIPLSPRAAELAKVPPFSTKTKAAVRRPDDWRRSSKELPPFGEEDEHTFEHSLEAQLPFLQRVLGDFDLVPIVFGDVDPKAVASALEEVLDDRTLVVASSDLSHYHPYDKANDLDGACIESIRRVDIDWMREQEACGKGPVLTLLHLAKKKGWQPKVLDYRNSGDTSGDRSGGVVGYAAIAFVDRAPEGADGAKDGPEAPSQGEGPVQHSAAERQFLLKLARRTVEDVVHQKGEPQVAEADVPEPLRAWSGCFVTLHKNGRLRGCIGHIFPQGPLFKSVIENATRAALSDVRFPSVRPEELPDLDVEVSILTLPRRLEHKSPQELVQKLRPGIDGVLLRLGNRGATYLPQVWTDLPVKERFLGQLAQKAGLAEDAWRDPEAEVLTYQADVFGEK